MKNVTFFRSASRMSWFIGDGFRTITISFSDVPLLSHPVSAAQNGDGSGKDNFQERIYTFKEIHEMAYYSALCALPDGQEYENFYCGQRGMGFPPGIRSTAAPGILI